MNEKRIARLMGMAKARGMEAIVLMPGPDLFYLTGLDMHLSERPAMLFLPVVGEPFAFCPAFEADRVGTGAGVRKLFPWGEEEGPVPVLATAIRAAGIGSGVLGVEFRYMRVLERELLAQAIKTAGGEQLRYEDAGQLVNELRTVKEAEELADMQKAAAVADAAMKAAQEIIRPGVSEQAVAEYIQQELRKLGAAPTLEMSIASGPRMAVPHAGTTDRVMQEGELCWVDFYSPQPYYWGDITRTFPVGKVTGKLAEIFRVCLEAQAKAREEAKPGMSGAQLDAIPRDYIAAKGYGEYFTHRTGHGIGLEVHEEPYIVGSNQRPLEVGNTLTIEPGIYIPGLGGVRIEDDIVIEANGARSLTVYPRDLLK